MMPIILSNYFRSSYYLRKAYPWQKEKEQVHAARKFERAGGRGKSILAIQFLCAARTLEILELYISAAIFLSLPIFRETAKPCSIFFNLSQSSYIYLMKISLANKQYKISRIYNF